MSAKIKKITLKLGDKEIELSVEEAKELKAILSDLFGPVQQTTYVPYYPSPWKYWEPVWYTSEQTYSTGKCADSSDTVWGVSLTSKGL